MPMPVVEQTSFFDPGFVCPDVTKQQPLVELLARHPKLFCPPALVEAWERPGLPGRDPWPFRIVAAVLLLRFSEEGLSRRGAARRCITAGSWRAAAGLDWRDRTPDESELRRFERFLSGRDDETGSRRLFLWLGHVVEACARHGVLGDEQVWVIDSTPMYCFGAILDTVRFLGDEARSLAAWWAKLNGTSLAALSKSWSLPMLMAKSTKGHFRGTDWSSPDDRAEAVSDIASTAIQVAAHVRRGLERVRSPGKRKRLARRCRNLLRKVQQDLETDDLGRLVVARRVVEDRLVSRTDPEARHATKSRKKVFNGYKLHVLGENLSGVIAAVCVTPANTHDSAVAHRLIGRAQQLSSDLEQVLGDTHYGGAKLRKVVRETLGVDLFGKPQALRKRTDDRFRREDFVIDFDTMIATCPAGIATEKWSWSWVGRSNVHERRFIWSKQQCLECPMKRRCLEGRRRDKNIRLHPYEDELRQHRERWASPDGRELYRLRSQGERHIHTMTRHGCRKARAWGLQAAQVQAHTVAISSNSKLLASALLGGGGT